MLKETLPLFSLLKRLTKKQPRFKPCLIIPPVLKSTLQGKFNLLVRSDTIQFKHKQLELDCQELQLSTIRDRTDTNQAEPANSTSHSFFDQNQSISSFGLTDKCQLLENIITDTVEEDKERVVPKLDFFRRFDFLEDFDKTMKESLNKDKEKICWDRKVHDIYNPVFSSTSRDSPVKHKTPVSEHVKRKIPYLNLNSKNKPFAHIKKFSEKGSHGNKKSKKSKKFNKKIKIPIYDFKKKSKKMFSKIQPVVFQSVMFKPVQRQRVRSTNNHVKKKRKVTIDLGRECASTKNKGRQYIFKDATDLGSKSSLKNRLKNSSFSGMEFRTRFQTRTQANKQKRNISQLRKAKENHIASVQF